MIKATPALDAGPARELCCLVKTSEQVDGVASRRQNADFTHRIDLVLLPIKAHYAAVAMLELALRYQEPIPVCLRDIADEHAIPLPFLTQILQQLRTANLVQSTRGAAGGYRLCRHPSRIHLAEIVQAVCPTATQIASQTPTTRCHTSVAAAWEAIDELIRNKLTALH